MRRSIQTYCSLASLLVVALVCATPARASVNVDSVELIDRTRVGRTTFNYTYRVTVTNTAPVQASNAVAYLTLVDVAAPPDPSGPTDASGLLLPTFQYGQNAGSVLLDDTVTLGDIPAGTTITSTDTFVLQQDRRFPVDPDSFLWEVGFTASVTLSGVVTDTVIPNANLLIELDRTNSGRPIIESGRPIIETYEAVADDQGRYSVTVDFVTDMDFVDITATGVDDLSFVALRSIVGSAGSLLANASDGPLQVTSDDVTPLNVTHVSTALADLAIEANGGFDFTNDEDLTRAQALIDGDELIIRAAVLKTVIDNPGISLPPGVNTTQELLDDPQVFQSYLTQLEEEFPDELADAIEETIIDIGTGFTTEDVPETLYLSFARDYPLVSNAFELNLDPNGDGSVIAGAGETTSANWSLDATGAIIISLNNPPESESFPTREVPPGSGNFQQVRMLTSTTELEIVRVAVGLAIDQVLLGSTTRNTFPDVALPDEINTGEPNPENVYVAFGVDGVLPVVAAELTQTPVVLEYYHSQNGAIGTLSPEFGADALTFFSNGTGTTQRRGFQFTWNVDGAGRLQVVFSNGDSNEYVRYAETNNGEVSFGLIIGRYGSEVRASDSFGIAREQTLAFDEPGLTNQKFRGSLAIAGPDIIPSFSGSVFDFNFFSAGFGCRAGLGGSIGFEWGISPPGSMQLLRPSAASPNRARTWEPIVSLPGVLGERFWVVEHLDLDFTNPDFPMDTSLVPGRINFYENLGSIAGNSPPTAVDDMVATPVDTSVLIDFAANDFDADGNALLIQSYSGTVLGGTITEEYNEAFTEIVALRYTPPPGASGVTDTFTYTLIDDVCAPSLPATVSIDIGNELTMVDEATFNSTVVNAVVIDFEGLVAPGDFLFLGNPGFFTQGGVAIANNAAMFVQNNDLYGTGAFLSPQQATPHIVDIALPSGTRAVGFYYQSAAGNVIVNGTTPFSLPAVPPGTLGFFGLTGSIDIQALNVQIAGPGMDIDNLTFGADANRASGEGMRRLKQ